MVAWPWGFRENGRKRRCRLAGLGTASRSHKAPEDIELNNIKYIYELQPQSIHMLLTVGPN
jgi:hypothetical protein